MNKKLNSSLTELRDFLDFKAEQYNSPAFISNDPIVIPHRFSSRQDIEIMGFFAATLAWGQRKTIINKCTELAERMDGDPYNFVKNHTEQDLKVMLGFKHRTFNDTDLLYFISFLRFHYDKYDSLEDAFLPEGFADREPGYKQAEEPVEVMLNYFRSYFFSLPDFPSRTIKHVSSPSQKSTCKRLNMFLRWMVRKDNKGVDFGIWRRISASVLVCPCDVHVERVARKLGLITRKQVDWKTAVELTQQLRMFDPADPVRYDFALFGLGIEEKF